MVGMSTYAMIGHHCRHVSVGSLRLCCMPSAVQLCCKGADVSMLAASSLQACRHCFTRVLCVCCSCCKPYSEASAGLSRTTSFCPAVLASCAILHSVMHPQCMQAQAEEQAWDLAPKLGVDMVSIIPSRVLGPVLSPHRAGDSVNLVKVSHASAADKFTRHHLFE